MAAIGNSLMKSHRSQTLSLTKTVILLEHFSFGFNNCDPLCRIFDTF